MPAWHRIDAAEIELGVSHGRQRTTLAHRSDLLAAADSDGSAAVPDPSTASTASSEVGT